MTLPCGHPEQAVVTDPDGTSYCAACEGQVFVCDSPEGSWVADSAKNAEIHGGGS